MVIEELDPGAAAEWDAYVEGKEPANCYHLHGWRSGGERSYGLRAPYLVARSRPRGELLGVLPVFFVRGAPLRGYATTGLFGSYGAVLAEDDGIAALLLREACRRAGLTKAELPAYATALQTLANSQMIRPREDS